MGFFQPGPRKRFPLKGFFQRSARLNAQAPTRSPPVEALRHREPTTCNGPFFQPTGACNRKRFRPFSSSGVLVQTEALRPANPNKTKRSFLVRPKRFAPREPFPPKRFNFYPFPNRSASLRPAAKIAALPPVRWADSFRAGAQRGSASFAIFGRKRFDLEIPINRSALLFSQTEALQSKKAFPGEALQSAGLKLAGALRSQQRNFSRPGG